MSLRDFDFFRFFLGFCFLLCLIWRDRLCTKLMENEMIIFFFKWTSLRDFGKCLCQRRISFIFLMFCFPLIHPRHQCCVWWRGKRLSTSHWSSLCIAFDTARKKRLKHHLHLAHYKKNSAVKYNRIFSLHKTHQWIQNINSGISNE